MTDMENEKDIMDQISDNCHQINLLLGSIYQQIEAARRKNFWPNLEKDIDESLARIKHTIEWRCENENNELDREMLKDGGFVYNVELGYVKLRKFNPQLEWDVMKHTMLRHRFPFIKK